MQNFLSKRDWCFQHIFASETPYLSFHQKKKWKKIKKRSEVLKRFLKQKSEFQLNKQINETLFILFYSSPPRNKEQKKQIKISGFSLLHYLFDNPYFTYKNYTPSFLPFHYTQPKIANFPSSQKKVVDYAHPKTPFFMESSSTISFKKDWKQDSKNSEINRQVFQLNLTNSTNSNEGTLKKDWLTSQLPKQLKWNTNQSRNKLINILNTNNFRDILFERFFNSKFYDIGLMGRKRLNKKLRLNIPLYCTALTPLDFLALFYKLFFLLNSKAPFNPIYDFLPDQKKSFYSQNELRFTSEQTKNEQFEQGNNSFSSKLNPISLVSPLSTSWEKKNLKINYESHPQETMKSFPGLVENFVPMPTLEQNFTKERMILKKSLLGQSIQTSSLDHLNQRHIRTSGEFLFLQFWRSVLRLYQILTQLSNRSNFLGSRPFVSHNLLGISQKPEKTEPSKNYSSLFASKTQKNLKFFGTKEKKLIGSSFRSKTAKLEILRPENFLVLFNSISQYNGAHSLGYLSFTHRIGLYRQMIRLKGESLANPIHERLFKARIFAYKDPSRIPTIFEKRLSNAAINKLMAPSFLCFFSPRAKVFLENKKNPYSEIHKNFKSFDSNRQSFFRKRQFGNSLLHSRIISMPRGNLLPRGAFTEKVCSDIIPISFPSSPIKLVDYLHSRQNKTFDSLLKKKKPSNQGETLNRNDLNSIIPFSLTSRDYAIIDPTQLKNSKIRDGFSLAKTFALMKPIE